MNVFVVRVGREAGDEDNLGLNASMSVETPLVRYIYLDIVSFTQNRSVEAQADLVSYCNRIVTESIGAHLGADFLETGDVILLPTGDGVCIAMIEAKPFDVHVQIALEILSRVAAHNAETVDESRQFQLRIGINQNEDTLVQDINGRKNVAGSGINIAQRVMSLGDGSHILIGQPVYEILRGREAYMGCLAAYEATDKHGNEFSVYQYFNKEIEFINNNSPTKVRSEAFGKKNLSSDVAYFMAYSMKNRKFLISRRNNDFFNEIGSVLLYFLAIDKVREDSSGEYDQVERITVEGDFESQYDYYSFMDKAILKYISDSIQLETLSSYAEYFVIANNKNIWPVVSELGIERLKTERPQIYNDFFPKPPTT